MKKILIVEDDRAIAEIERDFLQINDYSVHLEFDGPGGLQQALSGDYDLILLDIMLPGMDGMEICRRVRDKIDVPILMVTAKSEEIDKIRGLGIGADGYITKPFSPTLLVASVKAHIAQYDRIKHAGETRDEEISIGNIHLQMGPRRVFVDDSEIELKNKEYELLLFLMSNPDMVFNKDVLYKHIWGPEAAGDHRTVPVHVNRLREKIEADPANPRYIQTVWGAGYRFKA